MAVSKSAVLKSAATSSTASTASTASLATATTSKVHTCSTKRLKITSSTTSSDASSDIKALYEAVANLKDPELKQCISVILLAYEYSAKSVSTTKLIGASTTVVGNVINSQNAASAAVVDTKNNNQNGKGDADNLETKDTGAYSMDSIQGPCSRQVDRYCARLFQEEKKKPKKI